jgi:hypothetical protein
MKSVDVKLIVTSIGKKGKQKSYLIEVLDGDRVLHSETVQGVGKRDETVWQLAELYNALDIDMKESREEFKFAEIPSIPVLEEEEADEFFEDNKEFVFEGLKSGRKVIRLFELNGTGIYITSNQEDWKSGVQQALDYFLSLEQYDKCITARQLLTEL